MTRATRADARFDREHCSVSAFHDAATGSWQYVIADRATRAAAIIDPVLDFDPRAGSVTTANADRLLDHVGQERLEVAWVLDTHPHADHFSAASYLAERLGAPTAIGSRIVEVQALWKEIYCLEDFVCDGSQWSRLLDDGDTIEIGKLTARVMLSPGHTLASVTYVIGDCVFVHDTLMMPDAGTSRADFPGGDAHALYQSVATILGMADDTAAFVGHDYCPDGREPRCMATIAEQRADNVHVGGGIDEASFVQHRTDRDATLPLPDLMLAALQVNIRGGLLPTAEPCGRRFLKIPLGQFDGPAVTDHPHN